MPRIDVVHKIDGSAKFGIDAQVPGMVFAAINACPVPGGKLKSVDESRARRRAGRPPGGAARQCRRGGRDRQLLARQAGAGAAAARMGCRRGRQPRQRAAFEGVSCRAQRTHADARATTAMSIRRCPGAAKTFEAIYETPYLSHSPMEPMNATVHLAARPARRVGRNAGGGRSAPGGGAALRPEAGAGLYPQRLRRRRFRPPRRER